jgi:O-antigen/teichoic acid export membrane protein
MLLMAFSRVAQFLLLFLTLKVSTTLLAPSEMAKVFIVTSVVAFFAMLLLNPVGMFMNRRFNEWNVAGKVNAYYRLFWFYLIAVTALSTLVTGAFSALGVIDFHIALNGVLLLIGGSLAINTVNQVVIPGLNLLERRKWFVALSLATTLTSLVAAYLLVSRGSPKAELWIVGILFGQLVFAAIGWRVFFKEIHAGPPQPLPSRSHLLTLLKFAWPISVAVALGWFQLQSYRLVMEATVGLHALGLFATGYGISVGLISAFESIFTSYLLPLFYKEVSATDADARTRAWKRYAAAILPSILLVAAFILATAPELTRVMLGPAYQESSSYIGWGVVAELFRVTTAVFAMAAHAHMRTKLLMLPGLVGAVSSLALVYGLMRSFGLNGVGAALALSSFATFLVSFASTRMLFHVGWPGKRLWQSAAFGLVLIALSHMLRAVEQAPSQLIAVLQIGAVGAAFVGFQFILLRPLLELKRASPAD